MRSFYDSARFHRKQPLELIPQCGQCGLWEKCESPKIPVDGKGKRRVLIVGEGAGAQEDQQGRPFVGPAGQELERLLSKVGVDLRRDCWITNAIICRSHAVINGRDENLKPTSRQIGWCQPNLSKSLSLLKPDVVIPMGGPAIESMVGLAYRKTIVQSGDVAKWVGWNIPSQKLNCWVCPTYHPSYLLRSQQPALELHMVKHLKAAFAHNCKPWQEKIDWSSKVEIEMDHRKAARSIEAYQHLGEPLAFDYETTTLKPDGPHAQIICCSISNGIGTLAFPWHDKAVEAMSDFLRSDIPKVGHNLKFEQRWTRKMLGFNVRNWHYDGMLGAHWKNCQHGICGLDFQSFVLLGMEDYSSHLDAYMKPSKSSKLKGGNAPNQLKSVDPEVLLKYCAVDSLMEHMVWTKQRTPQ